MWCGAILAAVGMYFLSVKDGLNINFGDLLTLISAVLWAFQVIALSSYGMRLPPMRLAMTQFVTCAVLSSLVASFNEPLDWSSIQAVGGPLLYCGVLSVGVAFTLQVVGQRYARAAHAAIILSLEAIIAAVAGWVAFGEILDDRAMFGGALMIAGTLLAQLSPGKEVAHAQEA